jgi:DNA-directed RNA polymerase specialized sigma24 family protein
VTDFDDFVIARGPALVRFAYLLTGNPHQAEDMVQEALARSHPHWSKVDQYQVPEAYVRKAVLRMYLSWRRRLSSTEVVVADVPESAASGADHADRIAVRQQLVSRAGNS